MGINKQVFASNPERDNFYKLNHRWGDKYRLYHNLPFLNVFNTKGLVNPEKINSFEGFADPTVPAELIIDDIDFNRLKKTSIDYTLCGDDERPILCIEFDGLKDGFNTGTEYRFDGPPDPWRELITSLKLKVAHGSLFPFFVVGSREFRDLSEEAQLTMVDGIVGDVLAGRETRDRFGKGFVPEDAGWSQEEFDRLSPSQQNEVVQDWAIGVEVEADMTHNPISVRAAELQRQMPFSHTTQYLSYPDADAAKTVPERKKLLDAAVYSGCRCTLHGGIEMSNGERTYRTPTIGPVSATVWLPNFKAPGCSSMLTLLENMAILAALEKAKKKIAAS